VFPQRKFEIEIIHGTKFVQIHARRSEKAFQKIYTQKREKRSKFKQKVKKPKRKCFKSKWFVCVARNTE